ncbi:translation initiation factor IF-2-like [Zalophus californianus]|uniref:Translation initiation factor IF-2-like n=1 Tax=Zalophus californianus TaxID=9704 RepID=A0A6J2EY63_ZALCA|nr:translation initiation factor IF-2-like [Zalophus californianus]
MRPPCSWSPVCRAGPQARPPAPPASPGAGAERAPGERRAGLPRGGGRPPCARARGPLPVLASCPPREPAARTLGGRARRRRRRARGGRDATAGSHAGVLQTWPGGAGRTEASARSRSELSDQVLPEPAGRAGHARPPPPRPRGPPWRAPGPGPCDVSPEPVIHSTALLLHILYLQGVVTSFPQHPREPSAAGGPVRQGGDGRDAEGNSSVCVLRL